MDLVLYLRPKCRQGVRGPKPQKFCGRHNWKLSKIDNKIDVTMGEGVQKSQNFADVHVICEWSQTSHLYLIPVIDRLSIFV